MSRLQWHDAMVNLAAHPVAWPLARGVRHAGGVVRVPGIGVVINDAEAAHDVLTRDELFTKNGHGSIAASMTELFGAQALGNMDGEAHRVLRRRSPRCSAISLPAGPWTWWRGCGC
jgi:cytochrome P450